MKRSVLFFAILLVPAFLTACSKALPVTLFNNAGEVIEVHAGGDNETIAPGRFAQFKRPGESNNWVFRVSSGGCEYLYDASSDFGYDENHYDVARTSDRGIQIQVEKDFSVNLLPDAYVGDGPASTETFLKQKGFPLRPVSRKCH
jgi:hypothetical protein